MKQVIHVFLQVSELVSNLVQALPKSCTDQLTVIFANDKAAQHVADTAKLKLRTLSLGDAFLERLSGVLLIVGVKQNQARVIVMYIAYGGLHLLTDQLQSVAQQIWPAKV